MRKRPLFWTGVCLTAILACILWAGGGWDLTGGGSDRIGTFEEGTTLLLSGQVADSDLQPEGMRLFLNHIQIYSIDNSENKSSKNSSLNSNSSETIDHNNFSNETTDILENAQVMLYTDQTGFLPGDELLVRGNCSFFSAATCPGQFDALEYYTERNVLFSLKKTEICQWKEPEETGWLLAWKRMLYQLKYRICRSYQKVLREEQAAAMAAISLGEKQMLTQEQKALYQEGGISHILAISGLHISLIGMGLYRLLRKCGLPLRPAAVVSGIILVSYIEMVGWSASSTRACVMFGLWLGAQLLGRTYDRLTSLAAAALCILLPQPGMLLESAFQLSFLAILSLAVLSDRICEWLNIRSAPGKTIAGALSLSTGMLPCTLWFFYQTTPWSLLVNLAVVPLMSFVMGFGLAGGILGMVSENIGTVFAAPCYYLLSMITWLCRLEQQLPWNILVCGRPSVLRIVLYYAVIGGAMLATWRIQTLIQKQPHHIKRRLRTSRHIEPNSHIPQEETGKKKYLHLLRASWMAVCFLCWILMQPVSPSELEVTCLDVGQGDGSLIRLPSGVNCMIDGGSTSESGVWEYRIGQTAKYYGVRKIDWWFVSHSDQDHISGLVEFLEDYSTNLAGQNTEGISLRHLVLPASGDEDGKLDTLRTLAEEQGIEVYTMGTGDMTGADDGSWSLNALAPDTEHLIGEKNQDSLVLLLRYGSFRMLFTGDLEKDGERNLAESGIDLRADVLKVGHHGSKYASSAEFLDRVAPQVSVISCGANNRYGHPAAETVERLQATGSQILCTVQAGSVQISSDGTEYQMTGYLLLVTE